MIIRADAGGIAITGGAVNGDVLPKRIVIADFGVSDAALPFQVLGLQPDAGERKNFISLAQFGVPVNDDVGM